MKQKTNIVPPDGGYGWVIVVACALSNIVIIPLMQSFGLIFKDTFKEMGLSATEGSLIINMNAAFGMMTGLINGALLKMFGYRKVAIASATLVTVGIFLTSFATTFTHFIITYGLITSLGFGFSLSAYGLALNSYFKDRRSKATGLALTATGLGPILMPQIINLLMKNFSVQETTMILSAIAAHSFIAAILLQPVKWHAKKNTEDQETVQLADEEKENVENSNGKQFARSVSQVEGRSQKDEKGSSLSIDYETETANILGMESALGGSVLSLTSAATVHRKASVVSQSWKKASLQSIEETNRDSVYNPDMTKVKNTKPLWKRVLLRIVKIFDLNLLKDPIYVNIMIGMSLAIFAELNFSVLTPFILSDFGLDTEQSATFLSILGVADIIFRFFAPYIGDLLKQPPRVIYLYTLFLLMLTRFSLLITNNFVAMMVVALGLGIAKGIRSVYMSLVIPTYVPLDKLASASGIQMMVNGFFIMTGGPVIGLIRDITGTYSICIVVLNCITFCTVVIWTIEMVVVKFRKRKDPVKLDQNDALLTADK